MNSCIKLWLLPLLDTYPFAPSFWNILMTYSLSRSFSFPADHDLSCSIIPLLHDMDIYFGKIPSRKCIKNLDWLLALNKFACSLLLRSSFHGVQRIDYSGSQIGGISVFGKSNTLKDFMLVLQWSLFDHCLWGESIKWIIQTQTNER